MANDDSTSEPKDGARDAGKHGKARRRPPPTLDLNATDVTPKPAAPGTGGPAPSGTASSGPASPAKPSVPTSPQAPSTTPSPGPVSDDAATAAASVSEGAVPAAPRSTVAPKAQGGAPVGAAGSTPAGNTTIQKAASDTMASGKTSSNKMSPGADTPADPKAAADAKADAKASPAKATSPDKAASVPPVTGDKAAAGKPADDKASSEKGAAGAASESVSDDNRARIAGAGEKPPAPVEAASHPVRDATAPPAAPPRKMGLVGAIIAGVISGVLGGAVAFAVVSTFYSADQNIDAITELEARALDLRQRLEAIEGQTPLADVALPSDLTTRLDALESGLSDLSGKVNAPAATAEPSADVTALSGRVDALGQQVDTLPGQIDALNQKVGALPGQIDALNQKVDALPGQVEALNQKVDRLPGQVEALNQKVDALPAPAPSVSPDALAAVATRLDALEQGVAAANSAQQASGQTAAKLVSLSALREAITSGRPFAIELKAAQSALGDEAGELSSLQPAAEAGFPDGPKLASQLREAARAAAEAQQPAAPAASPQDGIMDRLVKGAQGLVSVRHTEEAPPALEEAEAALARNDFAGALPALQALPESQRATAAPVIASIEARQAALAAIAGLNQRLLGTLAGGAQ